MNTPPLSRPHRAHEPPKHKLPLNKSSPSPSSSHTSTSLPPHATPHSSSTKPSSPSRPSRRGTQEDTVPSFPSSATPSSHPPSPSPQNTTYVLSPGPSKPTLPTPWQQVEELSLIQRELTAELLATQGKNKALVNENASLRERVTFLEKPENKPSSRMVQLESENHRLSRDLALLVRQSYDRDRSAFDSLNNEVVVLKKEQQKMEQTIQESLGKQTNLHSLLQEMVQHEQEDRAGLDEIVMITEQYTEHLKGKSKEAEEAIRAIEPEFTGLNAKVNESVSKVDDARAQINEIALTCATQAQTYAALRRTVDELRDALASRIDDLSSVNNEVAVLVAANEGQANEIESLRKSLQVAVLERDEAKDELDFIRKRASTLEDELHFLKSEFSSKNTDVIERYTIQLQEVTKEANESRNVIAQLRADNAALEAALREEHARTSEAQRIELSQEAQETLRELARQTKLAEIHLQAVRDAERTNMILEEQLRQREADIAMLKIGGLGGEEIEKEEKVEKKRKKDRSETSSDSEEEESDSEGDYSDDKRSRSRNKSRSKYGEPNYKCSSCNKHKSRNAQLTQEVTAAKMDNENLQQKLDKMKNLIQIYRQEKRQMEEYIEKEKRTAKNMIALRDMIEEKQGLIAQLRDEVTHLRNEALRAQQSHAQQLTHAQDLARIQVQLKEDEIRSKLDVQANLQKEIQRLQAKLQRRKEELRASVKAKKDADESLEAQYGRMQMLDHNYLHSRHHHANHTSATLSYLHSLESRMNDMRADVARAKQMQASCEDEVITPLNDAMRAVRVLLRDAAQQFFEDARLQEEELSQLRSVVANLQLQPAQQQQQLQQLQQQMQQQIQQQQQQQRQYTQELEQKLKATEKDLKEKEQLVIEQLHQIQELKHEIRLLQLQKLDQEKQPQLPQRKPQPQMDQRPREPPNISEMYAYLEKIQELTEQLKIISDESLYATEKLEWLEQAQQRTVEELATQRMVFEEMRNANDGFMASLEEQLLALTMATPRYLDTIDDPAYEVHIKPRDPDMAMYKFVDGMSKSETTLKPLPSSSSFSRSQSQSQSLSSPKPSPHDTISSPSSLSSPSNSSLPKESSINSIPSSTSLSSPLSSSRLSSEPAPSIQNEFNLSSTPQPSPSSHSLSSSQQSAPNSPSQPTPSSQSLSSIQPSSSQLSPSSQPSSSESSQSLSSIQPSSPVSSSPLSPFSQSSSPPLSSIQPSSPVSSSSLLSPTLSSSILPSSLTNVPIIPKLEINKLGGSGEIKQVSFANQNDELSYETETETETETEDYETEEEERDEEVEKEEVEEIEDVKVELNEAPENKESGEENEKVEEEDRQDKKPEAKETEREETENIEGTEKETKEEEKVVAKNTGAGFNNFLNFINDSDNESESEGESEKESDNVP